MSIFSAMGVSVNHTKSPAVYKSTCISQYFLHSFNSHANIMCALREQSASSWEGTGSSSAGWSALVSLTAKRNDPTHQHTPGPLVRPESTPSPAPHCLQKAMFCRSRHGSQRAQRRGGYSPCQAKMHGMHTACQPTDKGESKYLHSVPTDPTPDSACLLCISMGRMQGSRFHPALPLPRGCSLPSSSIVRAQQFQDSVCSHAFLPDTKLCFGFSKPQWSWAPVTTAGQAALSWAHRVLRTMWCLQAAQTRPSPSTAHAQQLWWAFPWGLSVPDIL